MINNDAVNGIRVRGEGAVRIAVSGIDLLGKLVVQELANATCLPEDLFVPLLRQSTLHLLPSLSAEHAPYLKVILV